MAERIRRELAVDVGMVHGRYGEFKVFVDGQMVKDGGKLAFLGVMPSGNEIVQAVRGILAESQL